MDPRTPDARRRALGAEGEARAAAFLAGRGYRIAARNVRSGGVEIDIVAIRGDLVVFVEVKARRGRRHGAPEWAVDARKQARLRRAAAAWLREHPGVARRVRFDVIACEPGREAGGREAGGLDGPGGEGWRVRHLPGAFDGS